MEKWLDVLDKYYLSEFIASGGSAFKLLLTGSDEQTATAFGRIRSLAERHGYLYVEVSAAKTRVDRIQDVFFAISREIDWNALMEQDGKDFLKRKDLRMPENVSLSDTEAIAEFNGITQDELHTELRRLTKQEITKDREMCKEFRTAMAWLRSAQFFPRNVTPSDSEVLISWLCGEKVSIAALRGLQIYSKIDRPNARDMLKALTYWLGKSNGKGMVLGLNLSALLKVRSRGTMGESAEVYYTKERFLDACEVLREFIDDMDEMTHCLICAVAPYNFETGGERSLSNYNALNGRLINEVHDRERPNLLAAMVRL